MIIETPRLLLRPFTENDSQYWYELTQDPEIVKYVPYAVVSSVKDSLETIKNYYIKGDFRRDFYMVIESKENHDMIGAIIATTNSDFDLDMSLVMSKNYRHSGYMKEAVMTFCSTIKHQDFVFIVKDDNIPSLSLMKAIGAHESPYGVKGERRFFIM